MDAGSNAADAARVRSWDDVFRRAVAVKHFPARGAAGRLHPGLTEAWERWQHASHPGVLRAGELDLAGGLLTREWVSGFSLLEWLRHRRKVPAREALPLVIAAAEILDDAAADDLLAGCGIDKVFVAFSGIDDDAAHDLLGVPCVNWPAWSVRFEPLRLTRIIAENQATISTRVDAENPLEPAIAAWLQIVRELLGGARTRPGVPLAALNDAANAVLANASHPKAYSSAKHLAGAFAMACDFLPAQSAPLRAEYVTPDGFDPVSEGAALWLEARHVAGRRIQLFTGGEIRFGRSAAHADVLVRFSHSVPGVNELTKSVGRLHLRAQMRADGLVLLDGSATKPSRNGTYTSEGPLPANGLTSLRGPTAVQLGSKWRATFLPVPAPAELVALRTSAETAWRHSPDAGGRSGWGALFVRPWRDCEVEVETVWLIEEAGFGIDAEGEIVWDTTALGTAPVAFRKSGAGFVLVNRRMEGTDLSAGPKPIFPGMALPLRTGMVLKIGRGVWEVRVQ